MNQLRALIAEDEPILALTLRKMLEKLWPELLITNILENGVLAIQEALTTLPDIIFLDIKMPGKTGLEAAQEIIEEWPEGKRLPQIAYVTAYDEYAVDAFEHAASDYVLKPVSEARLQKTIERLKERLHSAQNDANSDNAELERVVSQLRNLLPNTLQIQSNSIPASSTKYGERLQLIRAAVGNQIRMIPITDVIYFEATDKYINVVTQEGSSLIRMSLRELLPQLDQQQFWQIHRSTIVNSLCIIAAIKDESGKLSLKLKDCSEKLQVSRVYAHLFKQM